MIMTVGAVSIAITPELQIAPPRLGEDHALAEVKSVVATMRPVIPTDFGRAVVRCTYANSTRRLCVVELVAGINLTATVDLARLRTGAWFASKAQVIRCEPK